MPQLNEYPIEELKLLRLIIAEAPDLFVSKKSHKMVVNWIDRVNQAISYRELSDSQLPLRTPKEIEQGTKLNPK